MTLGFGIGEQQPQIRFKGKEIKKLVLDKNYIDHIIGRHFLELNIGEINTLMGSLEPTEVTIRGYCKEKPYFINRTDTGLWIVKWKDRVSPNKINYIENYFSKEITEVSRDYNEIKECVENMARLLKEHDSISTEYNKKVANPFLLERKKTINLLFE